MCIYNVKSILKQFYDDIYHCLICWEKLFYQLSKLTLKIYIMSLIKTNKRRLFPWNSPMISPWDRMLSPWEGSMLKNFLSTDDFFNDDFFEEDSLMPAMNVRETDDKLNIELAAPGFSKKDFEVTLDEDGLHISAERSKKDEKKDKKTGYYRKEFSYNSFKRSLKLPVSVDQDEKVKATYENGILKIALNKKEEHKAVPVKTIEVA